VEFRHRQKFKAAAFASRLLDLFDGLLKTVEQVYLVIFKDAHCE